jgi:hypothetical protein
VDRTRIIAAEMAKLDPASADYQVRARQLQRLDIRAQLLYRALRILYASLGSFAAAALISVIGSAFGFYEQHLGFRVSAVLGFAAGTFAVGGLVLGCMLMVRETRVGLQSIAEEAAFMRNHAAPSLPI